MDKKISFYGTPLSRSLSNDHTDKDGPIYSRRARLNHQQIVRDSQGRQRFHGAFTGGFSAGYFNTVDSAEGFQPRHFVTRKGTRYEDGSSSKFSHKPEDYMDDEDLGEFGIAPRKIRVNSKYSNNEQDSNLKINLGINPTLLSFLKPATVSIGERILKRINNESNKRDSFKCKVDRLIKKFPTKNDFHGLGYKPLNANKTTSSQASKYKSINPLMAVLGEGKRLKISGEAFGSGVLEDDEDYMDTTDAYGYDDIRNYDFEERYTSATKHDLEYKNTINSSDNRYGQDYNLLPGFVLASNLDALQLCDNIKNNYHLPCIADDWKMPVRTKSDIPLASTYKLHQKLIAQSHESSSLLNKKFTNSSDLLKTENMETKAGLVLYCDLKAVEPLANDKINSSDISENTKATITRQKIEWRPCSLLCKHFNVPNPYPNNSFVDVKSFKTIMNYDLKPTNQEHIKEVFHEPASLELRQSIFDIIFANQIEENEEVIGDEGKTDSEDEPQVLEEVSKPRTDNQDEQSSEEDPDIVVVMASRQEPEVIVLTSSSSSPSSLRSTGKEDKCNEENQDDIDTYGPPLPPTLKTLIDLDQRRLVSRHRPLKLRKKKKTEYKC